jgi:hypothetical protein
MHPSTQALSTALYSCFCHSIAATMRSRQQQGCAVLSPKTHTCIIQVACNSFKSNSTLMSSTTANNQRKRIAAARAYPRKPAYNTANHPPPRLAGTTTGTTHHNESKVPARKVCMLQTESVIRHPYDPTA